MKHSATVLLALLGLAAAAVVPQKEGVSYWFRRNTYIPYNNNNNNNNYNNYNPYYNNNNNYNNYNPYYNNNNNYNNYNPYNNNNNNNNNYNPYYNNNNNNNYNNYNPYYNNNNNGNHNGYDNNRNYNPYYNNNNNNYNNDYRNNNYNNNNYNGPNSYQQGGYQFVEKQQFVLQLLSNLGQKYPSKNVAFVARNFNPQQNINRFYNQPAVQHFLSNYYNNNFLPKNEVFSPTSQEHQNQAAQLFHFFYSAQDWNTFKQAAAWARQRFNADQFAYAFTAAVFNHPATQGVAVPPLFEVAPHAFVPATALQQIYNAKSQGQFYATVYANYTNQNQDNKNYNNYDYSQNNNNNNNNYDNFNGPHNAHAVFADDNGAEKNSAGVHENPENRVSYFTEDVGVNAFHAGFHAQNPPFFGSNNNNNYFDNIYKKYFNNNNNHNRYYNRQAVKRGEAFYFAHQQLYARYVLERLSNNLPVPQPINFDDKIEPGYNPNLQYANGQAVPARPPNTYFQQQNNENSNNNNNANVPNNNQAENPQVYEQRLQEAAEYGFVYNEDGSKTQLNGWNGVGVLANLAAAPANSPNPSYYGDYFSAAKNAIGNIVDPNNQNGVAPGAVANYATAARDPAYYQFLAKLNQIFRNFQNKQGPYNQYQLSFPGVKIQSFEVSDLVTFFDTFNVNVNNAVNDNNNNNYNSNQNNNYNNGNNNYPNNYNNYNNNNNNNNYENNNNYNNNNYPNNYNNYDNNNNYENNNYNNNNYPKDYNNNNYQNNNNNNYNNNNYANDYNNNNNYQNNNNNNYNNNNYPNNYQNNNNNYPSDYNNYQNNNYDNSNNNGNYNVKFQRLTNKPFFYKLNVQSNGNTNAVVRVFLGPKYDSNGQQFTIAQASQYFVQLDQFSVQLNNGQNAIERNSQQSPFFVQDQPSFNQLWNRVQQASQGQQPFFANQVERRHFGFPQHSQLPKGKEDGQEFIFYAIITESNSNFDNVNGYNNNNYNNNYNNNNNNNDYNNNNNYNNDYNNNNNNDDFNNGNNYNNNYYNYVFNKDNKSVGFPFDRPVVDASYDTANQFFKTVTVYHKPQHNY